MTRTVKSRRASPTEWMRQPVHTINRLASPSQSPTGVNGFKVSKTVICKEHSIEQIGADEDPMPTMSTSSENLYHHSWNMISHDKARKSFTREQHPELAVHINELPDLETNANSPVVDDVIDSRHELTMKRGRRYFVGTSGSHKLAMDAAMCPHCTPTCPVHECASTNYIVPNLGCMATMVHGALVSWCAVPWCLGTMVCSHLNPSLKIKVGQWCTPQEDPTNQLSYALRVYLHVNSHTCQNPWFMFQGPGTTGLSSSLAPSSSGLGLGPPLMMLLKTIIQMMDLLNSKSRDIPVRFSVDHGRFSTWDRAQVFVATAMPSYSSGPCTCHDGQCCYEPPSEFPPTLPRSGIVQNLLGPDRVQWTSRDVREANRPHCADLNISPNYSIGKAPKGTVPNPSPNRQAATYSYRGSRSSCPPIVDGFRIGTPMPSPQIQSFFRSYRSIFLTFLSYIIPSTRAYLSWRPDAVMSMIGHGRNSVLQIFKVRQERIKYHTTCGALPAIGPYLRLSQFQSAQDVKQKR
ncbi:hypothetical protein FXO38_01032 [Capsicum annuum]|nr:hypothetical protein FXO38_01032 [Capsicum annuum]